MDTLRASRVREVHMIGRRWHAPAKFTTKELRELGELVGVDVSIPADEFDLEGGFDRSGESATLAAADRRGRGNLGAMAGGGAPARPPPPPTPEPGRKLRLRFWLRPVEIEKSAEGTVGGLRLERTRLTESG